jgi:hypothetical protein
MKELMMMKRLRVRLPGLHLRATAQSLVELALALGVVVLLLFGLIDAIQIVLVKTTLQHAAEAGANQAALIGGEDAGPNGRVARMARLVLDSGVLTRDGIATVNVACADPCRRYSAVTVTVRYEGRVFLPIGPFDAFAFSAAATRASEQDMLAADATAPVAVSTVTPSGASSPTPSATSAPAVRNTAVPTTTATATIRLGPATTRTPSSIPIATASPTITAVPTVRPSPTAGEST